MRQRNASRRGQVEKTAFNVIQLRTFASEVRANDMVAGSRGAFFSARRAFFSIFFLIIFFSFFFFTEQKYGETRLCRAVAQVIHRVLSLTGVYATCALSHQLLWLLCHQWYVYLQFSGDSRPSWTRVPVVLPLSTARAFVSYAPSSHFRAPRFSLTLALNSQAFPSHSVVTSAASGRFL